MEKINWICKSEMVNNNVVWSCRPKSKENFESTTDKMIGVKVSLKNVSTGGILADGTEGTIIKVANDSQPYLVARIDTPDVIWWYTQNDLKFPDPPFILFLSRQWPRQNNGPYLCGTTDGMNWFVGNTPGRVNRRESWTIKVDDTYYMTAADENYALWSSKNGKDWLPLGSPDVFRSGTKGFNGLIYYNGNIILSLYDSGKYKSKDGINWTFIPDSLNVHYLPMYLVNNKIFGFHGDGRIRILDENMKIINQVENFGPGNYWSGQDIKYDPDFKNYILIAGASEQADKKLLWWSKDGISWNQSRHDWRHDGKYSNYNNLTKSLGKWWCIGVDAPKLISSSDGGVSWKIEQVPPFFNKGQYNLMAGNNMLIYMQNEWADISVTAMYYTKDGIIWIKNENLPVEMKQSYFQNITRIEV